LDLALSEHNNNHRSSLEVRWRLIPVANDSPVVFLQQKGNGHAKEIKQAEATG
jgi:hypothetical protein